MKFIHYRIATSFGRLLGSTHISCHQTLFNAQASGIRMTPKGEAFAEQLYERHTVLTNMLMALGVDEETATEDACRIEHVISDKSFAAVKKHYLDYNKQ